MSVRWHHCIDHADTKQKPQMGSDCLLGVVPQPTDSRLSETIVRPAVVDLVGFLHLPCRGGKCSAALRQILVDVDLFGAVVIA